MEKWISDEELIREAKTIATVQEYLVAKPSEQELKYVALIKELARRLENESKISYENYEKFRRLQNSYQSCSYAKPATVTKDDLAEVESSLRDDIDMNWHEFNDRLNQIEERMKEG